MKSKIICGVAALASMALAASCNGSSEARHEAPVIDMAAIAGSPDFSDLEITDVKYLPLDTATEALLGERAQVVALMGDTVIVHDMTVMGDNSHIILFNINDGSFIGTIDHFGIGPGEYTWIESVYPDYPRGEIVIKGANSNISRYTLSDSLVSSKQIERLANRKFAAGSVANGINVTVPIDGNLMIHQFDGDFNVIDTLTIVGYEPMYISMSINNSGDDALMNVVDTLYRLLPGQMEPVAILSRGDKSLTPEVEQEVYLNQKDYNLSNQMRAKYIELMRFLTDDDHLMVVSMYNERVFFDIFDKTTGKHLRRDSFSYYDENPGLQVNWGDVEFYTTGIQFVKDGRFYTVINDDQAVDAEGNPNPDGNLGILSFRLGAR